MAALLLACAAGADTPGPGLRPGQYEINTEVQLPPALAARLPNGAARTRTRTHCITPTQSSDYYKAVQPAEAEQSSCTDMKVSAQAGHVVFDAQCKGRPTHFEGSFTHDGYDIAFRSGSGEQAMNAHIVARRVGECGG